MTRGMRVALVVGGGRGIGGAIAQRLAARGHHVEVAARTESELQAQVRAMGDLGHSAHAFPCDVTDEGAVAALRDYVAQQHGRLDVLVCAAGWAKLGGLREVSAADFEWMLKLHLIAPYALVRAFVDLLVCAQGTVVLIGSRAGNSPSPGTLAYAVSKAAVGPLVRGLGPGLTESGVRILSVNPGAVDTLLRRDAVPEERDESALATPESIATVVAGLIEIDNVRLTGAVVDVPW